MSGGEAPFARLSVVGFGLIGASVALAARRRRVVGEIVAVDCAETVDAESVRRAADRVLPVESREKVQAALAASDLVVLAAPVGVIEDSIAAVLEVAPLVTDAGSTKRAIVRAAAVSPRRGRFVPGHPMAGGSRGGAEHALEDLFDDRPWILCPEGSDTDAVDRVESFVRALGAVPRRLTAEVHDRAVAMTSHVPQLIASALAVCAAESGAEEARGPAFESATRVAGGGAAMWRDILATNADEVAGALDKVCKVLHSARQGLQARPVDVGAALAVLEQARRIRGG